MSIAWAMMLMCNMEYIICLSPRRSRLPEFALSSSGKETTHHFHTSKQLPADGQLGFWMKVPGASTIQIFGIPASHNGSKMEAAQYVAGHLIGRGSAEVRKFLDGEITSMQAAIEATKVPKNPIGRPKGSTNKTPRVSSPSTQPAISDLTNQVKEMAELLKKAGVTIPASAKNVVHA